MFAIYLSRTSNKFYLNQFIPLETARVDSGVRTVKPHWKYAIANACGKGATVIVEELKAQRGMREEVYVRRVQRHSVIAEEHSAAEFEIRHGARPAGEVSTLNLPD